MERGVLTAVISYRIRHVQGKLLTYTEVFADHIFTQRSKDRHNILHLICEILVVRWCIVVVKDESYLTSKMPFRILRVLEAL